MFIKWKSDSMGNDFVSVDRRINAIGFGQIPIARAKSCAIG